MEPYTGRQFGFTVDANILIKEITNRGEWIHSLVVRSSVARLFLAEYVWDEVQHEVPKRFTRMVNTTKGTPLPEESVAHLHMRGQLSVVFKMVVYAEEAYGHVEAEARERIEDPKDWPTIAVALLTKTPIWSEDKHFTGCGLPVWTTKTLGRYLTRVEREDRATTNET